MMRISVISSPPPPSSAIVRRRDLPLSPSSPGPSPSSSSPSSLKRDLRSGAPTPQPSSTYARDTTCDEADAYLWDRGAVCVPCDDCGAVGTRCARLRVDDPSRYAYAASRAEDYATAADDDDSAALSCNLHCLLLLGVIFMLLLLTTCTCIGNYYLTKERRKFSPTSRNHIPDAVWSDVELQDAHAIPADAIDVTHAHAGSAYVAAAAAPADDDTANDAAIAAAVSRIDDACDPHRRPSQTDGAGDEDPLKDDADEPPIPPIADVAPVVASEVRGAEICI